MDIAMVNPALIDARLDRIHRLVDGINAFKEQFTKVWSDLAPAGTEQPQFESIPVSMQSSSESSVSMTNHEPVETITSTSVSNSQKVTADDIDIDAMLSDIDLSGDFSL